MLKIAELMAVEPQPLNETAVQKEKTVAYIHEDQCIGCTKCIQACPVDAIVGARKLMHTVITKTVLVVIYVSHPALLTVLK